MNPFRPSSFDTQKAVEKALVSEILNSLGWLLIAESPNKSKVKAEAERYRGQLLATLDPEQKKMFLLSRDIVAELARQLATCQDRNQLSLALNYLQSLSKGEVLIANDNNELSTPDQSSFE